MVIIMKAGVIVCYQEILDKEYDTENLLDKLTEGYMNRQVM